MSMLRDLYFDKRNDLTTARRELKPLLDGLVRVSTTLSNRELPLEPFPTLLELPSAEKLQESLSKYRDAMNGAREAYFAIPTDERDGVEQMPSGFPNPTLSR